MAVPTAKATFSTFRIFPRVTANQDALFSPQSKEFIPKTNTAGRNAEAKKPLGPLWSER